jgi:hypothetical protein
LFEELLFLSQKDNNWQEKFFSVLHDELEKEDKIALEKMLFGTAAVNKKLSDEEQSEIDRILAHIN